MQHDDTSDTVTEKAGAVDVPLAPGLTRADFKRLFLDDTAMLDVRAPVEFEKGAFPQSQNLPLMTDEERHLVGIKYKEAGQKEAIALGAALVTPALREQRVDSWKAFATEHPDGVLYCFRGGLRSRISQQWLSNAGLEIPLIEGGYKALRTFLIESLEQLCESMPIMLVGGRTGNGKTLLINKLGDTVDLEALANHRGSSFGGMASIQPSNIDFENAVSVEMLKLDNKGAKRVFMEDEARLIGRVCLPESVRLAMQRSSIIILECDMPSRIRNCFDDYVPDLLSRYNKATNEQDGFTAFADHHKGSLERIQKRFGGDNYRQACALLDQALHLHKEHNDTSGYAPFIEMLLRDYYDPMYDYQLSKKEQRVLFKGTSTDLMDWAANS
mgnify:CR=1 FL=1